MAYEEIINSMDNTSRQTLHRVMKIVDSYEKRHKSHEEKLGSLFTLLLTKHEDIASKSLLFMENLKIIVM